MEESLKEISQLSIYLREGVEKISEVTLFQPLLRCRHVQAETSPRTLVNTPLDLKETPFLKRCVLQFQILLFRYFPSSIPSVRLTCEAKFKTILAILLIQENVRDFFLDKPHKQQTFIAALSEAAYACGYEHFDPRLPTPWGDTPLQVSRWLTRSKKTESFLDNAVELHLQIAAIPTQDRQAILSLILDKLERTPVTSVLEVTRPSTIQSIPLTTQYAKYQIKDHLSDTGEVIYSYERNRASATEKYAPLSVTRGVSNQHYVYNPETGESLGYYSGALSTPYHILEQILLITAQQGEPIFILPQAPPQRIPEKKPIVFTSLYAWDEIHHIVEQKEAMHRWDQRVLSTGNETYSHLDLLYFTISFSASNKYPMPPDIYTTILDINDETLVLVAASIWSDLDIHSAALQAMAEQIREIRRCSASPAEKTTLLLKEMATFRLLRPALIKQLDMLTPTPISITLQTLLLSKTPAGKNLKGIDLLIYFDYAISYLGYAHTKNCLNAIDRAVSAGAVNKAQHSFQQIHGRPYLPGYANKEEQTFFNLLYSLYLIWEEPEIHTAIHTGFKGASFYNSLFYTNPESTRYLVRWLKKHPSLYFGLPMMKYHPH